MPRFVQNHRRRRPVAPFVLERSASGGGLPVAPHLVGYVINLLPVHGADAALYNLACSLLGHATYRRLDAFVRPWRVAQESSTLFFGNRPPGDDRRILVRAEMPGTLEQLVAEDPTGRRLKALHGLLVELLAAEQARLPAIRPVPALDLLSRVFQLDEVVRRYVVFLYCRGQCQDLDAYCDRCGTTLALITTVARAIGVRVAALKPCFSSQYRLVQVGLIEHYRGNQVLSERVMEMLSGISTVPVVQRFIRRDADPVHPRETFPVTARDCLLAGELLGSGKPCRILLYGRAGTGKTEFARTLARGTGRPVYHVVYDDGDDDDGIPVRGLVVRIALYMAEQDDAVLIVDEADSVLNTRAPRSPARDAHAAWSDKGALNELLDRSRARTIWITNRTGGIEESTRRRFSFSLEFPDFTLRQRGNLWRTLVARHPLRRVLTRTVIDRLAAEFRVNAGGIVSALEALAAILPAAGATPAAAEERLRALLEKHRQLAGGDRFVPDSRPCGKFDLSVLRTDGDPARLVAALEAWVAQHAGQPPAGRRGASLLFWGAPGTGKSEFAKYLAGVLGLEVHAVRASDLFGPFVGMTERLVRGAFQRAAATDSLLLVDEADSFLGERTRACHSWEVSFVNEFLTRLENHRGLVICTTNMAQALDPAALRRFHWKLRFDPPDAAGVRRLLAGYFGIGPARLSPARLALLESLGLTPGDFHAVAERLAFAGPEPLAPETIAAELVREARSRPEAQGVAGFLHQGMPVSS